MIVKIAIGDICNISSAGDKPSTFEDARTEKCRIPVIANGVDNDGVIGYTDKAKITTEAVTVSARGNVGTSFYRNEPYYPVIRLLTITPKDWNGVNCKYLYYLLKNSPLQGIGSVQAQLTVPDVSKMEVFFESDYAKQTYIADVLSTIDSKIVNNNAICSNLEAMAKLLYDYWFVQFDFPDENGKPYKSSGGKMVWNKELRREIPAGWEAGVLGDVIEKYSDGLSSKDIGDLPYTPMDILPMRHMSFSETGSQDDANSSLIRYKKYSLLFGAMRPYFHRVCIAPFDGITRTTVFTLKERYNGELGYAYETLNQDYTVNYANAHHVGTQQPYAEWEGNLEKCPIPLPPDDVRRKYSQMISDYIDVVIERNLENRQLTSLRDFLLPMLMNGQVKIKE